MLNIVLFEPEIPQNTGNIMRTCVAIGAKLHLIEPLGFELSEKTLKRSALDYVKDLEYVIYKNYDAFLNANPGVYYFLSRYGKKSYHKINYDPLKETYLLFGKESTGFDKKILALNLEHTFRIPTTDKVRSINLANAVAIVAFDYMRQIDFPGCIDHEPESFKGKDFLDQFKGDNHGN
jgi:tRNA (cytidine/uridine-2'-O-)-methyltransferase